MPRPSPPLRLHILTLRRDLRPVTVHQASLDTNPFASSYCSGVHDECQTACWRSAAHRTSSSSVCLPGAAYLILLNQYKKIQDRWMEKSEPSACVNMNVNVSLSVIGLLIDQWPAQGVFLACCPFTCLDTWCTYNVKAFHNEVRWWGLNVNSYLYDFI